MQQGSEPELARRLAEESDGWQADYDAETEWRRSQEFHRLMAERLRPSSAESAASKVPQIAFDEQLEQSILDPEGAAVAFVEAIVSKLRCEAGKEQASGAPAKPAGDSLPPTKSKRSTERGEGRAKLIAALTTHHKYAEGGCLNPEPIGNNALARLAGVDQATASAFFKQQFKGHGKYKAACAAGRIAAALKLLNGEFPPHVLFGATPPGERDRDEE